MDMLQDIIVNVATAILLAACSWAFAQLGVWIKDMAAKKNIEISNAKIDSFIASLNNAVAQSITATNQKLVNDKKANGGLTSDDMVEAMKMTVDGTMKLLSADALDYLESNYDDLPGMIETIAEGLIGASKTENVNTTAAINAVIGYLKTLPSDTPSVDDIVASLRTQFNIPE